VTYPILKQVPRSKSENYEKIMEADGFTIYHSKKRKKNNHRIEKEALIQNNGQSNFKYKSISRQKHQSTESNGMFIELLKRNVSVYQQHLNNHAFFLDLLEQIEKKFGIRNEGNNLKLNIISYGIGDLVSSNIAQLQLACFLCIKQKLEDKNWKIEMCSLYDPIILINNENNIVENLVKLLKIEYDIDWMETNDECKHECKNDTVFFMPHCTRRMYQNVILSNIHHIERICIFGNSFSTYLLRHKMSALLQYLDIEYCLSHLVWTNKRSDSFQQLMFHSFNDSSLHWSSGISEIDISIIMNYLSLNDTDDELITRELLTMLKKN
jgi:hypothetical protein